jgi:hypothetical protein
VLLLVALPAVLAKVGEGASGKRVPKQVHTKGEYQALSSSKSSVFWHITSCSMSKVNRRFGGTCRIILKGRRINHAGKKLAANE